MKRTKPPATNKTKFDWKKRQSGGPKAKPDPMGFGKSPEGKGAKKSEAFADQHKEYRKEVRKPR